MYKSPVSIMETAVRKIVEERDNEIFYKIQSALGVDVDRGELMRALQYDRNQYEKGYADGKADAMAEIVRCKDCKYGILDDDDDMWKCVYSAEFSDENGEWFGFIDYNVASHFCSYGERRTDAETD